MPRLHPIALCVVCALSITGCAITPQKQARPPTAAQPLRAANSAITAEAMVRLGRYFEGQARHEKAIAAYREALKRDPLLVEAYTGLGMALAAQRRYDDAIRQFQAAVVLAPYAAHLHNNLGYAYLLSGAHGQAVEALEQARRLDPGHEKARDNLRVAQAKLAPEPAVEPTMPALTLVQVAPQIFELRSPARYRKIEAVPLAPLPKNEPAVAPAPGFKLEVSNGNGVLGMAKLVAARLASAGVKTARLTNQRPFEQARTEIQYREGYAAAAAGLAGKLEHPAKIVPSNDLAAGVDVRVVLGKDMPRQALERSTRRSRA